MPPVWSAPLGYSKHLARVLAARPHEQRNIKGASILALPGHVDAAMQVVFDPRGGGPQPGDGGDGVRRLAWRMLKAFPEAG